MSPSSTWQGLSKPGELLLPLEERRMLPTAWGPTVLTHLPSATSLHRVARPVPLGIWRPDSFSTPGYYWGLKLFPHMILAVVPSFYPYSVTDCHLSLSHGVVRFITISNLKFIRLSRRDKEKKIVPTKWLLKLQQHRKIKLKGGFMETTALEIC